MDSFFSFETHMYLLFFFGTFIYLFYIGSSILTATKEIQKLEHKENKEQWDEIDAKVLKKGYFLEYDYPHTYSGKKVSDLDKLANYELKRRQSLERKRKSEQAQGNVTVHYDAGGSVRRRITLSNDPESNYLAMLNSNEKKAYRLKKNPKIVVFEIPNEKEIQGFSSRKYFKIYKETAIYGAALLTFLGVTFFV